VSKEDELKSKLVGLNIPPAVIRHVAERGSPLREAWQSDVDAFGLSQAQVAGLERATASMFGADESSGEPASPPPAVPDVSVAEIPAYNPGFSEEAPPTDLGRVTVSDRGSGFAVFWEPVAEKSWYLVVGHSSKLPEAPCQAEQELAFTDEPKAAVAGQPPNFIAVFAFSGVTMDAAITRPGRLIAADEHPPEADRLSVFGDGDNFIVKWRNPIGITDNVILRSEPDKQLEPGAIPPGQVIHPDVQAQSLFFHFEDPVKRGPRYRYRIYTQSTGRGGQPIQSRNGIEAWNSKRERLPEITKFTAEPRETPRGPGVRLEWCIPEGLEAEVVVIHSDGPPKDGIVHPPRIVTHDECEEFKARFEVVEAVPYLVDKDRWRMDLMLPETEMKASDGTPLSDERMYFRYTLVSEGRESDMLGPTVAVPMVAEVLEAVPVDRVDWQLVRMPWPKGAVTVEAWDAETDRLLKSVDKRDFTRCGGVALELGGKARRIRVRGAKPFAGETYHGASREVSFEERPWLRYSIVEALTKGVFRTQYQGELTLERYGDCGEARLVVAEGKEEYPPDFHLDRLPGDMKTCLETDFASFASSPQPWRRTFPRDKGSRLENMRLYAGSDKGHLMVSRDPATSGLTKSHGERQIACPECFAVLPTDEYTWECPTIGCAESTDLAMEKRHPGQGKRHTAVTRGEVFEECPTCGKEMTRLLCPHCHARLPRDWMKARVLTVSVAGDTGSGKTTYLWVLLKTLKEVVASDLGLDLSAEEHAVQYLDFIDAELAAGRLDRGTARKEKDPELFLPLLFKLQQSPTDMYLSLFDSIGGQVRDRSVAQDVYGSTWRNSDLVVVTVAPQQIADVDGALADQITHTDIHYVPAITTLANVLTAIGDRADGKYPRLAVVLTMFDQIQLMAGSGHKPEAECLNPGDAVFKDPYQLAPYNDRFRNEDSLQVDAECRNLLRALRRNGFLDGLDKYKSKGGECRLFAVSAVGGDCPPGLVPKQGLSPFRVADPLRWALEATGLAGGR